MHHRTLGRTGIAVSPYGLGAMMFATSVGNPDPADSARMIHKALDAGINLIDTADAYGDSEEVVGKALRGRRDDVVLATKFGRPVEEHPHHRGASRRWIVTAVEDSLRRLQVDHIDLYQVHRSDPTTDVEETLAALTDLLRTGKIRAIGASQSLASDIVDAQWVAERRGLARFRSEQTAYSLLNRGVEREVLPLALLRPITGAGSLAFTTELIDRFGPDSLIGRIASTVQGSTDTTLYVLTVYFGAVGIRKTRYALKVGLLSDLVGFVASVIICLMVFA